MKFLRFVLCRTASQHARTGTKSQPKQGIVPNATQTATTAATQCTNGTQNAAKTAIPKDMAISQSSTQDSDPFLARPDLPLTQHVWDTAAEKYLNQLRPDDKEKILRWKQNHGLSTEDVDNMLLPLRTKYTNRSSSRAVKKIYPFLEHLRSFGTVVDVCVQASPNPAALIWGGLRLVLEVACTSVRLWEMLEEMLESISSSLPLFETWLRLFPEADHAEISESVSKTFHQYLDFLVNTINFFTRSPMENMLRGFTFPKFRLDFERRRAKIRGLSEHLLIQIHTAGLQASESRHIELRQLIQTTSNTSSGSKPQIDLPKYLLQEMPKNSRFHGRTTELNTMKDLLQDGAGSLCSVAIHGVGGSGKSTLALEYAYRTMKSYDVVAWLHADSETKLCDDFGQVALQLGLVEQGKSLDRVHEVVLNWLAVSSIKWLLIFDNADDADILMPFWPKSRSGCIIATSRDSTIVRQTLAAKSIKLQTLNMEEGSSFFRSQLDWADQFQMIPAELEAVEALVREFDGLPLGLATAAVFMDVNQHSPTSFMQVYCQRKDKVTALQIPGVDKTLQTLWDVSLATLDKESIEYLNQFAFLDPDSIPMSLFESLGPSTPNDHPSSIPPAEADDFHDALAHLSKRSLIEVNRIAKTIKLHRYLQSVIQTKIRVDTAKYRKVFGDCLALVRDRLPPAEFGYHRKPQFWDLRRVLGSHIDYLTSMYAADADNDIAGVLVTLIVDNSFFHLETYQTDLAFKNIDLAKSIAHKHRIDAQTLAFMHYTEGLICNDANRTEQGLVSFELAMKLLEDILAVDRRKDTLKALSHVCSSMGNALTAANRFLEAETSHRRAIDLYLEANDILEDRLARLYANLGSCLLWKGDLVAAETVLHKALLRYDRKLCCTLYALGNVYLAQQRLEKAYEVHLEILEIFSKRLGRSHPVTADSCFKVGCILSRDDFARSDLKLAEDYLRKALVVYEATVSKTSLDSMVLVARTKFMLGVVLERCTPAATESRIAHAEEQAEYSPAELKAAGLQFLQSRLGPGNSVPENADDVLAMFNKMVFYWSR